jgi:AraC-like DNA-binding protein
VGDSIKNFYSGDLVLIGSNTPHVWSCSQDFYVKDSHLRSKAICIQFEESQFFNLISNFPEFDKIIDTLESAKRGMRFKGRRLDILSGKIQKIPTQEGMERLINLFSILEIMSSTEDYVYLSSPNYQKIRINNEDADRLEVVFQYVINNFNVAISLEHAASLINLTPHSFCRYFKSRTNKVFSTFVNEVRIGHACKLLIENNMNVSQICYESGYNYVSNFNRQFRKIKKMTPVEFQKKYWNKSLNEHQFQD